MALSPGDRISKIQAIGRILEDWSLIDIDLALDSFDASVRQFAGEEWVQGDKYESVLQRLSRSDDATLIGLHAHLYEGTAPDEPVADLPAAGEPLVFISHTSAHKNVAAEVSTEFTELSHCLRRVDDRARGEPGKETRDEGIVGCLRLMGQRVVNRPHDRDPDRPQPSLGRAIIAPHDPNRGDAGRIESVDRVGVELTQLGRDQRGPR